MLVRFCTLRVILLLSLCVGAATPQASVVGPPGAEAQSESDTLLPGEDLYPNQGRTSSNSQYRLVYQGDGNLVLYEENVGPIWASNTEGTAAGRSAMQHDGNFVIYDAAGTPLRDSGTWGNPGAKLVVQSDGNVVIYTAEGVPIWDRSQWGEPPPPPGPTSLTFIINGFESNGEWALPGTDFSNAVAATYGAVPEFWFWSDNSWQRVLPPAYSGILNGAQQLANFLYSLPPGDVNLIAHSHGGNVVLLSQIWSTRPIRRYITLATPVNWDWYGWRFALDYGIAGRCQASSTADFVQLWGASPYQVGNFVYNVYQSIQGAYEAFDALFNGNYEDSLWYFAQSVFDAIEADYWLDTTKREVEGYTHFYVSLRHSELHTPGAWNGLPAFCR